MSDRHNGPIEGSSCMCCWEDLLSINYVEYKGRSDKNWLASGYCETCVNELLRSQWNIYTSALAKVNCKKEQKRLLSKGPPQNLFDATALPCGDGGEVDVLWFMSNNIVISAKLHGSLTGEVSSSDMYLFRHCNIFVLKGRLKLT